MGLALSWRGLRCSSISSARASTAMRSLSTVIPPMLPPGVWDVGVSSSRSAAVPTEEPPTDCTEFRHRRVLSPSRKAVVEAVTAPAGSSSGRASSTCTTSSSGMSPMLASSTFFSLGREVSNSVRPAPGSGAGGGALLACATTAATPLSSSSSCGWWKVLGLYHTGFLRFPDSSPRCSPSARLPRRPRRDAMKPVAGAPPPPLAGPASPPPLPTFLERRPSFAGWGEVLPLLLNIELPSPPWPAGASFVQPDTPTGPSSWTLARGDTIGENSMRYILRRRLL
mmetsp:Transcript_38203/g.107956  ORF Transcript_38203/g.107956 Transcript_38203/m.107956 type:complete len:282 (+) Transcript_38203:651-1496(+)